MNGARLFWRIAAFAVYLAAFHSTAEAAPCRSDSFEGAQYTVCSLDLAESDIRIFWRNQARQPYRTFSALATDLADRGLELTFAINGGMYGVDFRPIGLLVEDGAEIRRANTADPPAGVTPLPNFYKKPNGIFHIGEQQAGVTETEQFLKSQPSARFATQSGPMLVIDGAIHPDFIEGSSDRRRRSGVCVSGPTEIQFAISEGRVNFQEFARLFRDRLACDNALYLDGGSAPGLYAPELGRNDPPGHGGYGPIIGAVRPM